MSIHNLCFELKYEEYQIILSENFHFLVVKFSVYLSRNVFLMAYLNLCDKVAYANSASPNQISV